MSKSKKQKVKEKYEKRKVEVVNNISSTKKLLFSWFISLLTSQTSAGKFIKLITYRNDEENLKRDIRLEYLKSNWDKNIRINKEFKTKSSDGFDIHYEILTNKLYPIDYNDKFVIFCHGLTSTKVAGYKHSKHFIDMGYNFVTFSQRGYGEHYKNRYTTLGDLESIDVFHIINDIKKHFNPTSIVLYGESMGAATVLEYGNRYDHYDLVDFYIADSPFLSLESILEYWIKKVYKEPEKYKEVITEIKKKLKDKKITYYKKIDFSSNIKKIKKPVFFSHSFSDTVIPIQMTKELYSTRRNANLPTTLLLTHGKPHITSFKYSEYYNIIGDFLKEKNINTIIEEPI